MLLKVLYTSSHTANVSNKIDIKARITIKKKKTTIKIV